MKPPRFAHQSADLGARPGRASSTKLGVACIALAVAVWTGFAVTARNVQHSGLTVAEVAAIRYVVPTLLLAPWSVRASREIRAADPFGCLLIAAGAGIPFFLLTFAGAGLTTALHVSVINLAAPPVGVAAADSDGGIGTDF